MYIFNAEQRGKYVIIRVPMCVPKQDRSCIVRVGTQGPRVSYVRILSACEKTHKKLRQESCDLRFFKNTELFLDYALGSLPGVVARSEFTSHH